jgi:hypothetical protein
MAATAEKNTTTAEDRQRLSIEVPERLGMNYLSMSGADSTLIVVMQMLGITFGIATGKALVWFASLVITGLLLCRADNGRIYYIFGQWWVSRWMKRPRRKVPRGTVWQAEGKSSWVSQRRPPPMPFNTGTIGEHFGFMDFDSADVIVIEGTGASFISLDPETQYRENLRLAELKKRISAAATGYSIGISYVFRRRPADVHEFAAKLDRVVHPDVAVPEAFLFPEDQRLNGHNVLSTEQRRMLALHSIMGEELEVAETYTGQTTMAMVVTVQRDSKAIRAFKGKSSLSEEDVKRLTMHKVKELAVDGLRRIGVSNPRALGLEDINLFVRRAHDVANISKYYDLLQKGLVDPYGTQHWPQERMVVFDDHCIVDDTYHAVLRIRRGPPKVMVDYFRQLHAIDVPWLTVGLISETVSSTREYRILNRGIALKESFDEARGVIRQAPHVRARDQGREKREMELFQSRFGQAYVPLIGVSAPCWRMVDGVRVSNFPEFDDHVNDVIKAGHGLGLNIMRVNGAVRQLPALWSVSTGLPML